MPPLAGPPGSCLRASTPKLQPSLTRSWSRLPPATPVGCCRSSRCFTYRPTRTPGRPLLHGYDLAPPERSGLFSRQSGLPECSTHTIDVMEVPMRAAVLMLLFTSVAFPLGAQTVTTTDVTIPPPPVKTVSLSGPRFGFTALSEGVVADAQAVEPSP